MSKVVVKGMDIPVEQIKPSPYQPRMTFDLEDIKGSIMRDGILVTLTVRKKDGFYELVDGERRLRVVKELGYETVKRKPPKSLEGVEAVQGIENLYQHESACGYHTKLISSVLGVRFFKPFLTMRSELVNKRIMQPWEIDLRRMRSILPTDWLTGDNKGYGYFMRTGSLQKTLEALCQGKFHQDTALFQGRVDGVPVNNRIYLLKNRDELIAI